MYIWKFHKNMRFEDAPYMPFPTEEREAGVWYFKVKAGNLQVAEKEQTW